MTGGAKGNEIVVRMFLDLGPRYYVRELDRNLTANGDGASMARLNEDFTFQCGGDCWTVICHILKVAH